MKTEAPYKAEPNPIIAKLRGELAEARTDEIMAIQLGHNTERWTGYINGLRRAIEIVEGPHV